MVAETPSDAQAQAVLFFVGRDGAADAGWRRSRLCRGPTRIFPCYVDAVGKHRRYALVVSLVVKYVPAKGSMRRMRSSHDKNVALLHADYRWGWAPAFCEPGDLRTTCTNIVIPSGGRIRLRKPCDGTRALCHLRHAD